MLGNVRDNHWQLKQFRKAEDAAAYTIEAIGHSASVPKTPVLSICGTTVPVTLSESAEPLVGLKSKELEHWSFHAEIDLLHPASHHIEMNLICENEDFLPLVVYLDIAHIPNVPDSENIVRVGGQNATQQSHLANGRKDFYRFDDILRRHPPARSGAVRLLDWGIGCGRVARHYLARAGFEVCGLDIDKYNIDWLNQHLPQVDARVCALNPPTSFGDDEFDVVLSFSVLSHLIPANWELWLAELARVSRPGALAALSFHGDHSAGVYFGAHPALHGEIMETGYRDHGGRTEIGGELFDYYRDVFYSDAFAASLFSKHFEVVEILPGLVSGFQSVAVLRKT